MDSGNHFNNSSFHRMSLVPAVEGSHSEEDTIHRRREGWVEASSRLDRQVTIGMLPDEVLLEIFDFYIDELGGSDVAFDAWHMLVHVCRRWRNLVFISPRRLHLRLHCTYRRSVEKMLDIWPELPIVIDENGYPSDEGADNIVDALGLKDRVSSIHLWEVSNSLLERCAATMQDPFPVLTDLRLRLAYDIDPIIISDSFLGGSAPSLRWVYLSGIPFPGLPNLLLSATNLSYLRLEGNPYSGYISPEAMVTCLSGLTRLEELHLKFSSFHFHPDIASQLPPPLTRTLLPALTCLSFQGTTEYLKDLVSRINVPSLKRIEITLFDRPAFDMLELHDFLRRASKFAVLDEAEIEFGHSSVYLMLSPRFETVDPANLKLRILCDRADWQLSSLLQACILCTTTLSTLTCLTIREDRYSSPDWRGGTETTQWLDLLFPFANVRSLYLSNDIARLIAPALRELAGERVMGVLPALQDIFLDRLEPSGPVQEAIGQFVAARQLSYHPVAIHVLERETEARNELGVNG